MNKCFLLGKIINEIVFKFAIGGYHNSIIRFQLQLENGSVVNVKAFDKLADFCYQSIKTDEKVMICGRIESNFDIVISEIYSMKANGGNKIEKACNENKCRNISNNNNFSNNNS